MQTEFDVSAINVLRNRKRTQTSTGVAERKREEKKASLSDTDGRRLRRTGRTVPVNFKVKPEFKQQLLETSKADGVPMVVILERALEAYRKKVGHEGR